MREATIIGILFLGLWLLSALIAPDKSSPAVLGEDEWIIPHCLHLEDPSACGHFYEEGE